MKLTNVLKLTLTGVCVFSGLYAHAAGFEKTVMWSGKWAALGGAATGAVDGADALFFNPAGLAEKNSTELSLNYSPLLTHVSGAQAVDDEKIDSDKNVIRHVSGALFKKSLTNNLALATGVYVSGGAGAKFRSVDYSSVNSGFSVYNPVVKSDVKIIEYGLGAGYKINNNFSVGATYRITMAMADFSSASVSSGILFNTHFDNMTDFNFAGVRLGAKYLSDDKTWGLGLSYRSEVKMDMKGDAHGEYVIGATSTKYEMTGGKDAVLHSQLPNQVNFGGFYKYSDRATVFAEYSWTDYSQNDEIKIDGELKLQAAHGSTNVLAGKTVKQNWKDAHILRLGHEYLMENDWAIRTGYAFTSRVTSRDAVSITFTAPGVGHTFVAGAGTKFLDNKLALDFAGEYSFVQGSGTHPDSGVSGEFFSSGAAVHTSLSYLF